MIRRLAFLACISLSLLTTGPLSAACTNPAGPEGEAIYNGDHKVMQFCNGTNWVSMAASGMGTEVDPHVGTLTNGKWCSTDGTIINCTADAPAAGGSWGITGSDVYYSSGSVGIGTATPAATALLDVTSTTKGLLPPRMTTTQRDAISSPATGLIIYNTTTTSVEVYNGTAWASIGASIPNGTIAAFAAATCPTGWTEYTAARGRFLRGIDNGAGNDPDGTRAPGAVQADMFKNHSHGLRAQNTGGSQSAWSMWNGNIGNGSELATSGTFDTGGTETRPKNVAVIFCSYSGGGGGGGGGSTTLGGLTDVNVSGVVNGQALVYNTASSKWIPGTATAGASGTSGLVQFSNGTTLSSDTVLYWDNGGKKLGIGTASPSTTLQVIGTATATTFSGAHSGDGSALTNLSATNLASGTVATARLGSGTASASTYLRGDGAWAAVSGGALSSLSDVTLTSPANGNVLTYNGSKWVNVGAGSAMGTTTMVPGFPDAIICTVTNPNWGTQVLMLASIGVNGNYYYRMANIGGAIEFQFTSAGAFSSSNYYNGTTWVSGTTNDCGSSSLSTLYANGKAFNFIGSSLVSAAAPAGGVQFNNGSGVLAADSALVWDNTNKRLGVGTTSPGSPLHVVGVQNQYAQYVRANSTTGQSYGVLIDAGTNSSDYGFGIRNVSSSSLFVVRGDGNVGIGTYNPVTKLDVVGAARLIGNSNYTQSITSSYDLMLETGPTNRRFYFAGNGGGYSLQSTEASTGNNMSLALNPNGGSVGIGTNNSSAPFEIYGVGPGSNNTGVMRIRNTVTSAGKYWNVGPDNANAFTVYNQNLTGMFIADGNTVWSATSDKRLKKDITPLRSGLATLQRITPVTFHWRDPDASGRLQMGVIAQEVEKVLPEIVDRSGPTKYTPDKTLGVQYTGFIPPIIKAIQELKADNDNLRALVEKQGREFEAYRAAHP